MRGIWGADGEWLVYTNFCLGDFQFLANMQQFIMGASALWSNLIDTLGWVKLVDEKTQRDDCNLSVGKRLKALLVNIGTDRKALYKVQEFYEKRDVEVLLGEGVVASDLNDDALGRALDILYDMNLDELYPEIALHTVKQLKVFDGMEELFGGLIPVHVDTTSISLTSDYPDQSEFEIVRGYSKDHRPDLKQIILGLGTVRGLGLCANVDNGNQDDHTWNFENIPRVMQALGKSTLENSVYIGDAAVVSKNNLDLLAGEKLHFISRLPSTYKLCSDLKRTAWVKEDAWQEVGRISTAKDASTYRIQSFRRELYGNKYRFIAVRSSSLDAQKEHKLQDVLKREEQALQKSIKKLSQSEHNCEEDAIEAAQAFVHKHKRALHGLQTTVVAQQIKAKRASKGRPRKDEPAPEIHTKYRIETEIVLPTEAAQQAWREREATFVLITDILDDQRVSDEQILRLYKDQYEIEHRFRFLKSPYHVGPIFLHKPSRVKAFAYIMLLSLLLYSAFEYLIREQMAMETEPIVLPGKRKSFRPTGISVLEMLEDMTTIHIKVGEEWKRVTAQPHDAQVERILGLLGFDLGIYSEVKKSA